jgi:hypothetical protein
LLRNPETLEISAQMLERRAYQSEAIGLFGRLRRCATSRRSIEEGTGETRVSSGGLQLR